MSKKKKQMKYSNHLSGTLQTIEISQFQKQKGSICALVDGDDLVSKNWFKNGLEKLKRK